MTQISNQIWIDLEASKPRGEELVAKSIITHDIPRLLCAIDSNNQRHILIPLQKNESQIEDTRSRGLSVKTRELQIHGESSSFYIDIQCKDSGGYSAFNVLVNEIASEIDNVKEQPSEIVRRILAKWRRFWGQAPKKLLSKEEITGLFAELWFLSRWLIPAIGPLESVKRWKGPYGARHDFEWKDQSVEVKASTSMRGRIHHIHGLEQLESPENGNLDLFSLRLREEGGGFYTLPILINECRNIISGDEEALFLFETGLVKMNYSPIHDEDYNAIHYRIVDEALYSVTSDFPRLISANILNGLPFGIEGVEYIINLNGYDHLIRYSSPREYLHS